MSKIAVLRTRRHAPDIKHDRHTAKIIAHAVAHGLNIANRDSYTQALVAQERERSAKRDRNAAAGVTIAVIARAHSARRSR